MNSRLEAPLRYPAPAIVFSFNEPFPARIVHQHARGTEVLSRVSFCFPHCFEPRGSGHVSHKAETRQRRTPPLPAESVCTHVLRRRLSRTPERRALLISGSFFLLQSSSSLLAPPRASGLAATAPLNLVASTGRKSLSRTPRRRLAMMW